MAIWVVAQLAFRERQSWRVQLPAVLFRAAWVPQAVHVGSAAWLWRRVRGGRQEVGGRIIELKRLLEWKPTIVVDLLVVHARSHLAPPGPCICQRTLPFPLVFPTEAYPCRQALICSLVCSKHDSHLNNASPLSNPPNTPILGQVQVSTKSQHMPSLSVIRKPPQRPFSSTSCVLSSPSKPPRHLPLVPTPPSSVLTAPPHPPPS
jgi:hypothetical protein